MRIAVDMDEVIADALPKEIALFNQRYGTNYTKDDLQGKKLSAIEPDKAKVIHEFFLEPDFFADLDVLPGAFDALKELSQEHEIYITTAAMEVPPSFQAKFHWLAQHFPFISPENIVFCGNKTIIHADYLIDDHERHFASFAGQGLLFTAPHNVHSNYHPRVNNWQEVLAFFQKENR